jgi:tRNA pseudouridine32 synthase/23S rRNA pseudouridine746 synthase
VCTPERDRPGKPAPTWPSMGVWLDQRLGESVEVSEFLAVGRFVYESGGPVAAADPYRPTTFVWFHRDLAEEPLVPGPIHLVYRDDRIVVIDKPPFLSSIPRGRHVVQSVVVRLRAQLQLPELSPLHRLDRVTSGLLVLATERRWRGAYQSLFQRGEVTKVYRALAPLAPSLQLPVTVRNHLRARPGQWQSEVVPGAAVNAESLVEREGACGDAGRYRLTPRTGRTHQLRLHLLGLGIPIQGDPIYPVVTDVSVHDFTRPLQLLASELVFTDPIDGGMRAFESVRRLPLGAENQVPSGPAGEAPPPPIAPTR